MKPLFQWLDLHPGSYWVTAIVPALMLGFWIGRLVRQDTNGSAARATAGWTDATLLLLFLLAWRWPFFLVADEFNPDEGQLIAGAITLAHDPVFWRAVDGTTSGPLNFYALLPLHWAGLPLDYFTARLAGLLMVFGALFACLRAIAGRYGRGPAWLGVLPGAAFFATATHSDLIHYSSEHVSVLLVGASAALLAVRPPTDRWRLWTAMLLAGAAPWAKLQSGPLAMVLIAWGAWQAMRASDAPLRKRLRLLASAAFCASIATLVFAVLTTATGQFEHAMRRYFEHNLFYVSQGTQRTTLEAFRELSHFAVVDGHLPLLLGTVLAVVLAVSGRAILRRRRPPGLVVAGACLVLAALAAILAPRREYLHYLLLLPVPLTFWGAAAVGEGWQLLSSSRARCGLAVGLVIAGGIAPLVLRGSRPVPMIYGEFSHHWRFPRTSASMVVRALASENASVAVWGWDNRLYVEAGLRQATRDAHSTWSIIPNAARDYHRAVYLDDLRRNDPDVFVDSVGPRAFLFVNRSEQAHEIFPALADHIRERYVLVTDLVEARIYARRDLPALAALSPERLEQLVNQGRLLSSRALPVPPPLVAPDQSAQKVVERRKVLMVPPPSRIEWALEPDAREAALEFGIDPIAQLQGGTDGAEIILEVTSPSGHVREVFRRLIDPAHQADDLKPCFAQVKLPPFGAGARLVLRTTPGPAGNDTRDWVYLAALEFRRSATYPREQFPGFSPVPDEADAVNSGTFHNEEGEQLLVHAPASLAYKLTRQRRLQFSYGLQAGAYTGGGNTDGAVFRVELERAGQSREILFERRLDPVREAADRGPQRLDLALPAVPAGARLVISIDPGPNGNGAWDWTYVGHLTLK